MTIYYYLNGEEISESLALQIAHEFTMKRCLKRADTEAARSRDEAAWEWISNKTDSLLKLVVED
jgi:hypothetical protein